MTDKCMYPGCEEKPFCSYDFKVKGKKDTNARLPVCEYHNYVVMGDHFCVKQLGEDTSKLENWKIELKTPINHIELIEQVMAAREMIRLAKSTTEK